MKAALHPCQSERLRALYAYEVLDMDREKDFDDIAQLTAAVCGTPIALVSLVDADRQWFKASVGFAMRETPIETSLCSHAILEDEFIEIEDTMKDPRMVDNPLCCSDPGLRFYAGALLKTADGLPIGTLCVLDHEPRSLTPLQRDTIKVLARQVMMQFEMRKALGSAAMMRQEVDHRVKNSLQSLSAFARIQQRRLQSEEAKQAVAKIMTRIDAVSTLHEYLYKTDAGSNVDLGVYLKNIVDYLAETTPPNVTMEYVPVSVEIGSQQAVSVGTLVNEFVANSFKHAFPDQRAGVVRVELAHLPAGTVSVTCSDNGIGMPPEISSQSGGLGMKIAEIACMELRCELDLKIASGGVTASIEFTPEPRPQYRR
ncbi:histidine kinase dimerization/phosphoacceptor domain -containing protein [Hoeflea sp. YIM 152468]|uniref:histidine kinase dimerization/phosphoacceptor domain -containing protein n=1 Tax=Hoeflea sp. YIM 152468 TaxID=3031759 RepID=UPI0023DA8FDC|nr:histidine kinase dimerization/phosphoacceptor domain -containing protein [Hoeflea sp. YIM 152468]MDF1609747.1 histidine kinase dimerization/phosphoacceptor domain -containing protein [Hoeflea sp. YIM 152468]